MHFYRQMSTYIWSGFTKWLEFLLKIIENSNYVANFIMVTEVNQ